MPNAATDPVLQQFRAALLSLYGERLERAMLYGSRARGDALPDSDYDVVIFLKDIAGRWEEMKRLADLSTDLLEDTGEFVHAMPYRAGAYAFQQGPGPDVSVKKNRGQSALPSHAPIGSTLSR